MLKLWEIMSDTMPRSTFIKAKTAEEARMTFLNAFMEPEAAHLFASNPSFKVMEVDNLAAFIEAAPNEFMLDEEVSF